MTKHEIEVITAAICAGIETAIHKVFVKPSVPGASLDKALSQARTEIRHAVEKEIKKIRPQD